MLNVKRTLVIVGLLAAFTTTSAFAYTSPYYYTLIRGGDSKYTNLVTKDDGEQNVYVTATSNNDWQEGQEGYMVRVRDQYDNAMMTLPEPIYTAGSYEYSYDEGIAYAGQQYRLWASYNDDQPFGECYATGRWCP